MLTTQQINQARAGLGLGYVPSSASQQPSQLKGEDLANHYLQLGGKVGKTGGDSSGEITPTSVVSAAKNFGSGLMDKYRQALTDIPNDVKSLADTGKSETPGKIDSFGGMVKKSMALPNLLGDSLKAVFAPVTQGLETGVEATGNAIGTSPALEKFTQHPEVSKALDYVKNAGDELNKISSDHPEAAHAINSLLTIATAFLGEGDLNKPVSEIGGNLIQKGKNAIDSITGTDTSTTVNGFHGTTPENATSIKQNGFDLSKARGGAEEPVAINLTTDESDALHYAGGNKEGVVPTSLKGKNIATFNTMDEYTQAVMSKFGDYTGPNATKFLDQYDGVIVKGGSPKGDMLLTTKPENISIPSGANPATEGAIAGSSVEGGVNKGPALDARGVYQDATGLADRVRLHLSESNVSPQLGTSAKRLGDPVETYNDFVDQEKKFMGTGNGTGDIMQDPVLAKEGSQIGKEFDKVVAQRRAVGTTMETELKKVGGLSTDIAKPMKEFDAEVASNLGNDSEGTQSRLTSTDEKMLKTYQASLQKLGPNPTIKNLDSFISRQSQELDLYKGTNNIVGTTNGERIIKNNLSQLREQFNPKTTGNKDLTGYYNARKTYSDLSDFLDDGITYLGQKGTGGDYVRDASVAKSAVQSILNNGKKDWLIKLQALTGYPALDRSVLALQAMKDLGDFRGSSLLETTFGGGKIPYTPKGVLEKIVNWGLQKGARLFTGTPEDQTRLFLQSLNK